MTVAVCVLLIAVIALSGICFYLIGVTDDLRKQVKIHFEWIDTATDLFETISNEQDKGMFRLKVAEERILNLQNRTGQIQIKLRKMEDNTIYEVKDGE